MYPVMGFKLMTSWSWSPVITTRQGLLLLILEMSLMLLSTMLVLQSSSMLVVLMMAVFVVLLLLFLRHVLFQSSKHWLKRITWLSTIKVHIWNGFKSSILLVRILLVLCFCLWWYMCRCRCILMFGCTESLYIVRFFVTMHWDICFWFNIGVGILILMLFWCYWYFGFAIDGIMVLLCDVVLIPK